MPFNTKIFLVPVLLLLPAIGTAELVISGVDRDLERNIRAFVSLEGEDCDAEDWLVRRRFRKIESETRKALEPFGFYRPQISPTLSFGESCWQATLEVTPGEPVRYRDVHVQIQGEADSDTAFANLKKPASLEPGAVLHHADYDRVKRSLQVRAADRGYVEARFLENRIDIWPEELAADIALHFDSGPRYRIGAIEYNQSFLEPAIVAGYVDLQRGEYFNSAELAAAHRALAESAYFGSIDVIADRDNATNGEIPIRIELQPGTRIEYTVGVGASTDTSARFRAGFRNNRINTRGHRFIADLAASPVVQSVTTEYRIPLSDPRREWFSFTGALSNEEVDTFDNEAQRVGIRWTKSMGERWLRTLSLDASNESFIVGQDVNTTRFVVPGISFDQKFADRDVFPSKGRRLGAELRGTSEALGSTANYFQASVWMRWIRSFGSGNRVLARLNAGATSSPDFEELPPSVRFFAGGDESVRGYDYNSLGPKDVDGNVVGGSYLLVASLEYERHLRGDFYGAVFVDAGNAFDDADFDTEVGAGLGIKWRSPLGPIRLYLGYPVTADDQSVRIHLRLGADL
ncbi:MAG: autotransporter assembly complex family protein [Pseudomonadota bacterium]